MENWKPAPGYDGIYEVSDCGNVRRIAYFDSASLAHHGHMLYKNMKQTISKAGYYRIKLMNGGTPKIEIVHRLVAKAFIPNPNDLPCVNHIDGVKAHNYASNLEWCTYEDNGAHAYALGLRVMKNKKGSMRTAMIDPRTGEILKVFPSGHEASRQTGIAQTHIQACCKGRERIAGGYFWKYL